VQLAAIRPRQHVIHDGGQVVDANLVPAESPEAGVTCLERAVPAGMGGAPGVRQPDVKAAGMKLQRQGSAPSARHEVPGGSEEAVHQEEGAQLLGAPTVLGSGNAVQAQPVAIGGLYAVHLALELLALHRLAH